jgi:hypothetical protein
MKTNQRTEKGIVKTVPDICITSGRRLVAGIDRAKRNLAAEFQNMLELPERLLQVALNEAEALAWETGFPQLVFPTLATEKVEAISAWYGHGEHLKSNYAMAV